MFFRTNKPKTDLSDAELIDRFRNSGDKEYVGVLFQRYSHMVAVLCYKYLKDEEASKDAALGIFEVLFTDLRKHEVRNFKTWIYSVTKNHCLKLMRTEKRINAANEEFSEEVMEFGDDPSLMDENLENQPLDKLQDGLHSLNEEQRVCIELFYLKGKRYKEIETITGYDLKKVKSYIQNGKRNLKIYLENHGQST